MTKLINETRTSLHWLSNPLFTRVKYRNIRPRLQKYIYEVFNRTSFLNNVFQHTAPRQSRHIAVKTMLVCINSLFSTLGAGKEYFAYLAGLYPSCNQIRSNKISALNTMCILEKQDSICPIMVLKVSYWMSSLYFRLYKQRCQHIMLDDVPPDKLHRSNLPKFQKIT